MIVPERNQSAGPDVQSESDAPPAQTRLAWQTPRLVRLGAGRAGNELGLGSDLLVLTNFS
jgi:hypothetical protein